jgi:hypothetical protein
MILKCKTGKRSKTCENTGLKFTKLSSLRCTNGQHLEHTNGKTRSGDYKVEKWKNLQSKVLKSITLKFRILKTYKCCTYEIRSDEYLGVRSETY